MNTLYVIPGSHACRSAMLMLQHKRVPYRRVDTLTLTHSVAVRLHGFDAGGQTRSAGTHRPFMLRLGDLLGTVPALASGKEERISTNHGIARFLEERYPEHQLFPADPEQRAAVEEAERWANETLQMPARRLPLAFAVRDPVAASRAAADGRLGYLLYRNALVCGDHAADRPDGLRDRPERGASSSPSSRRCSTRSTPGSAMVSSANRSQRGRFHDRAESGPDPLPTQRMPMFEGRPALELVDRLLPGPSSAP